jgi:hypothetical protein
VDGPEGLEESQARKEEQTVKTKHLPISLTLTFGLMVALLWLLGAAPIMQAQAGTGVIRVATTGNDTPGCGTVGTPCRTVQYAVDQAAPGDEIRVATGNYTGVQARPAPPGYPNPSASGLITQAVYISKTVVIRGGYTTADWNTPDPDANPTTLNAQGQGRGLVIAGTISPTVEGLRITAGQGKGLGGKPWAGLDGGGGVYVISATATISNCLVYGNDAPGGGGLYLYKSTVTLTGNSIYDNHAPGDYGGGLYLDESDATLAGNFVHSNDAKWGGGLYLWKSNATLAGNSIHTNLATVDGGGLFLETGTATLSGNTVYSNTANWAGGGLALWTSNDTLTGNSVYSNTADWGGGLYLWSSGATFTANAIYANAAIWGGGFYVEKSNPTLVNNVVADNRITERGSGLYIENGSSPRLVHNTIARNTGGDGSGVHVSSRETTSTVALTNTILVSHTVGITVATGSAATLESTLWYANGTNTAGAGTIHTAHDYTGDPAFAADGYHLTANSAAIDQGVDAGVTTDIDAQPRPNPDTAIPDLGADEFYGTTGYRLYLPLVLRGYAH